MPHPHVYILDKDGGKKQQGVTFSTMHWLNDNERSADLFALPGRFRVRRLVGFGTNQLSSATFRQSTKNEAFFFFFHFQIVNTKRKNKTDTFDSCKF